MRAKGLKPENFGWYLEMFKYGFPPHGGFGMGVERLTLALLGLDKIMEAMAMGDYRVHFGLYSLGLHACKGKGIRYHENR